MCKLAKQIGLQWELKEDSKSFNWYKGRTACDAELEVGAVYSIGVKKVAGNGGVTLEQDFYRHGGLSQAVGDQGAKLKQLYRAAVTLETSQEDFSKNFSFKAVQEKNQAGWFELDIQA